MSTVYTSVVYDLSMFGVESITSGMIASDKDSGVSIELSFDGGSTFRVYEMNEKFDVEPLLNNIVCRVGFENNRSTIYTIKATGNFPMLAIGTSLFFTSAGATFQTTIGPSGSYSIQLPDETYRIWYNSELNDPVTLDMYYSPKLRVDKSEPVAKEAMVEMFMRDLPWAKFAIFDVYENLDKMTSGNSPQLDVYGNLVDVRTNKVCRWWALGFTDE